jgi:hypothetical protein
MRFPGSPQRQPLSTFATYLYRPVRTYEHNPINNPNRSKTLHRFPSPDFLAQYDGTVQKESAAKDSTPARDGWPRFSNRGTKSKEVSQTNLSHRQRNWKTHNLLTKRTRIRDHPCYPWFLPK